MEPTFLVSVIIFEVMAKPPAAGFDYKIFSSPSQNETEMDPQDLLLRQYENAATANRLRLDALKELFDEFDRSGVEALPLKGMDLLLRGGRAIGWRSMSDVDLLIRREQVAKALSILEKMGFSRRVGSSLLMHSFADEGVDYISPDRQLILDIIWNFWYHENPETLWQRTLLQETSFGERRLLHPVDALLFLIVYAVAHRGRFSPGFAQDLEVLIKSEAGQIDWKSFVVEVTRLHLKPLVYHGLVYAKKNGLSVIPEEAISALRPESLSERFTLWFFSRMVGEGRDWISSYLLPFFGTPGWRGKRRLLRRVFFPPMDFIEFRCGNKSPRERLFVGFFRPFRIFVRSLFFIPRDLLRLFFGQP